MSNRTAEEEVKKLTKKIQKYHDNGNTTSMVAALTKLRQTPMTIDILRETKVGVTMNHLRQKVTDKEVKQQMKNLIKFWKNVATPDAAPAVPVTPAANGAVAESDKTPEAQEVESEKNQTFAETAIPTDTPLQMTDDDSRNKRRMMLAKHMKKHFPVLLHARCNLCAEQLETALWNNYKANAQKLKTQFMSKLSNLKDPKNPALRTSFLNGIIKADELARMTHEQMASDELKKQNEAYEKENLLDHQVAVNQGTETDMFTCGKCKKKRCTYTQLQTRSSDEPMTTFVFCMECGNRWKFC